MKLQTLLDISSHGIAPVGVIDDIGIMNGEMRSGGLFRYTLNPLIRLENGPMCERWLLELSVHPRSGEFTGGGNGRVVEPNRLIITPSEPLFPRRATRAGTVNFFLAVFGGGMTDNVTATLSVGSALPVERKFRIDEFRVT